MRDSEALDVFEKVGTDLARLSKLWVRACRRAHEHAGLGYPASSDSAGSNGGGVSNPVLANVMGREVTGTNDRHAGFRGDNVAREIAEAAERTERMRLDSAWLLDYVYRYTQEPPRGQAPPSCRICAKVNYTTTVYAQERCRVHYDHWVRYREDLHLDLTRWYCEGRRLTASMIARYHQRPAETEECTHDPAND